MNLIQLLNDGSIEKPIPNSDTKYAFIDESGNYGFNFENEGNSTHFIITTIIIDEGKLANLEVVIEDLRKKHFQTGEMKSSKIGNDDLRRIKILKDICNLDFHIFSLVVHKKEIRLNTFHLSI